MNDDIMKWLDFLPKKTGVYCRNTKDAKFIYEKLVSFIPKDLVVVSHCIDGLIGIRLKDGRTIRFVLPYESTEHLKFDRIYIYAGEQGFADSTYYKFAMDAFMAHQDVDATIVYDLYSMLHGGAPAEDVFDGHWIISSDGYYPYCSVCGKELSREYEILPKCCPSCNRQMSNGEERLCF